MNGYYLVFWKNINNKIDSFEEISKKAYELLNEFNTLNEKYRPNYLTVYKKSDAVKFNWDYEEFSCKLKKSAIKNKSPLKIIDELGYNISFFSSLSDEESFGYNLIIDCKNNLFINTFTVNIPSDFNINTIANATKITELFEKTIKVFEPFWAGAINQSINYERSGVPRNNKTILTGIHWLNYFSPGLFENINYEYLININSKLPKATFKNNILKIQNLPINEDNINDLNYLKEVEDYLFDL